jgi:NADPH:quinone reductase-like Zn-dependent oxidoreductase
MSEGYAHEMMTALHNLESGQPFQSSSNRLPLICGRDFAGQIVEVGTEVRDVKVGDQIIGVVPPAWQGSHAEYVLTNEDCIALKPSSVDAPKATANVYALATLWTTFKLACIQPRDAKGLRVLIHGGSGGVGTTAIQMLRAWNAGKVVATCSEKK